jgi:uncharacterized RDD family membrane protein YckC
MSDETLTIETPEHVELQFALASIGNRFLACAIDHFLQLLFIVLVFAVGNTIGYGVRDLGHKAADIIEEGRLWILAATTLIAFLIYFGYFTLFEVWWNGQTPGKRWLRLRVIREDGRPVGFFATLTRNLIRGADMMPMILFLPFYSIGIVSVFASPQSRRLGDYAAGTVVIKERAFESPSFDEVFEHEVVDTALRREASPVDFRGDVRLVDAAEIGVIETFMRRRHDLPAGPRQWLAERLATPVLERIRPYYNPDGFSYEGFLEELLARHRASAKYRN